MGKIVVYTAICGGIDKPRYDIPVFNQCKRFKSERLNAKIYKCLPHLFMPEASITIWLDGNIQFKPEVDIAQFVKEFLGDADIAAFRHPYRDNLYQEAAVCSESKLDDPSVIEQQVNLYQSYHFLGNRFFAECGVLVRRNRSIVNRFNETWWAHVTAFSSRDQISFPFAANKHPMLKIRLHKGNVRTDERFIYTQRESSRA